MGTPAFAARDPCQQANDSCAWSPWTQLCAPFEAVAECPATREEANELRVYCNHSDQPDAQPAVPTGLLQLRAGPERPRVPEPPGPRGKSLSPRLGAAVHRGRLFRLSVRPRPLAAHCPATPALISAAELSL